MSYWILVALILIAIVAVGLVLGSDPKLDDRPSKKDILEDDNF